MGQVCRARRRQRGFTLDELLVTVGMIGIMSVLAMVGYRKYLYSAQSSEAKNVIQMIRGAQEAYKSEMLQYLNISSDINTFYPLANPQDHRVSWDYPAGDHYAQWKQLAVNPDAPVRFGYACTAGIAPAVGMSTLGAFLTPPPLPAAINSGTAWYEIQAKTDHNNNGVYAVFGTYSMTGEIWSENEAE